jgi:Fe2+ or Zn2+ uptake regulation protein
LVDRNLERVEQLGFVGHVHLGHGLGLHALARDGDSQYLGCEQCGRVTAVDTADLDPVRENRPANLWIRRPLQPLPGPARATARRGT